MRERIVPLHPHPTTRPVGKLSAKDSASQKSILGVDVEDCFPAFQTTLILVPDRLLTQWVGEFEKFLPPAEFGRLRIAQVRELSEWFMLRVGDIQNFDVILMSYDVLFDPRYRARLRKLVGIQQMTENQCPTMNLLREATGRFMRNPVGGGIDDFGALTRKINTELRRLGLEDLSPPDVLGARPAGKKAGAAKGKALPNKRQRDDRDEGDREDEHQEQDVDVRIHAPGQNVAKGGVRQFWKAKARQLEMEEKKWPEWWHNENGNVRKEEKVSYFLNYIL